MKIPSNLSTLSRNKMKRLIRTMQRAIYAECRRCMGTDRFLKDCDGLNLADGECPLYDLRPKA